MTGTIRVADLIGSVVVGPDGERRGKVVDIVITDDQERRIIALEIGTRAWIDRLNMANVLRPHDSGHREDRVAWEEVDRWENGRVYLA